MSAVIRLSILLLAIALGIWLWQRRRAPIVARSAAAGILLVAAAWLHVGLVPEETPQSRTGVKWQPFSQAVVDDLRARGTPVLVDFTAAWCITCQVNKHTVLGTEKVARVLEETGTTALRADWTKRDARITEALAQLGRNGVPVYALYGRNGNVTLLPELLTTEIVVKALREAAASG